LKINVHHLPEAYAYLETITDTSGHPVDYRFLGVNPVFEQLTGLKARHIIGKGAKEVLPVFFESSDYDWIKAFGKAAETGETLRAEQYSAPMNKWLEVIVFSDETGRFSVLFIDITRQKQQEVEFDKIFKASQLFLQPAEQVNELDSIEDIHRLTDLLMERQRQLKLESDLFTEGPIFTISWKPENHQIVTRVSSNVSKILGYTPAEMTAPGFIYDDLFHPEDKIRIRQDAKEYRRNNVIAYHQEYRLMTKSGEYRWFYDQTRCIRDEAGVMIEIRGYLLDQTSLKETQAELAQKTQRLENIIEGTHAGTWEWNVETGDNLINERWAEIIGYTKKEMDESIQAWETLLHPADRSLVQQQLKEVFDHKLARYELDFRMKHKKGHWVWILSRGKVISWTDQKKPRIISGTHTDVTEKKEMEEQLFIEKELFKTTLLSVPDAVIATDISGNILIMNPVAEKLTGWTNNEVRGKYLGNILKVIHADSRLPYKNPIKKILATGMPVGPENQKLLISRNGLEIDIEDSAAPIKDSQGRITGMVLVFWDCTEKKEKQQQIEYLSFHDYLTGLYNRRYMEEELKRLDTERNLPLTVMILDVNDLKLTNDAYGHAVGDQLLKTVADLLARTCRADEVIARMGGDEFAIILPRTGSDQAEIIKERIEQAFNDATLSIVTVSVAIGYAVKTDKNEDIKNIIMRADDQMYMNKRLHEKTLIDTERAINS
jgi:diguanylate cyclase